MRSSSWLWAHLVCPEHGLRLERFADKLECLRGDSYPIVQEVPVLLPLSISPTQSEIAERSRAGHITPHDPPAEGIHPHVMQDIGATGGRLYQKLGRRLTRYPIPDLRLPAGRDETLLDIGCNWGRWTISAARRGYRAVGIDPNLDAVLAARQVAASLNVVADFVVGDARRLPFESDTFDVCFSYSVLQHFSKSDATAALDQIQRVLRQGGTSLIQMPNGRGLVSFATQARRRFREPTDFDVRYWTPTELTRTFTRHIGPSTLECDTYLGLGAQPSDADLLPPTRRAFVHLSERLRKVTELFKPAMYFADSLYVRSKRMKQESAH